MHTRQPHRSVATVGESVIHAAVSERRRLAETRKRRKPLRLQGLAVLWVLVVCRGVARKPLGMQGAGVVLRDPVGPVTRGMLFGTVAG